MSHNEFDSDDDYGPGCAWVLVLPVVLALIVGGYGVVLLYLGCFLAAAAATFLFLKEMIG